MKLRVRGTDYDYRAVMREASLGDLREMKRSAGFGQQGLYTRLQSFMTLQSLAELTEDEDKMDAILGLAFLALRSSGEMVSWAEVCRLKPGELQFVLGEEDLADPQVAPLDGAEEAETEPESEQTEPTPD